MTWRQYPAAGARRKDHTRKEAPFSDHRLQAIADALDPKDHERIIQEAKDAAAQALADFEQKRGKR